MTPITTRMNFSRCPAAALLTHRPASSSGASSTRISAASARMNQSLWPIGGAPTRRPPSDRRGARATRVALQRPQSSTLSSFDSERALSVIECELLVLTYHCDAHPQTDIKVDRAKWAPERSIPKHVQQNKIGARRAARQRAKRARRGFCGPAFAVRLCGPSSSVSPRRRRDPLGSCSLPSSVTACGQRDRLVAGSKSDAVRQRESQPRL